MLAPLFGGAYEKVLQNAEVASFYSSRNYLLCSSTHWFPSNPTDSNPKIYTIHLGEHNREVSEGTEEVISAKRIISHPQYNKPVRINNDIALIQLARPATLNSRVQTVCLPSRDDNVPTNSRCFVSGERNRAPNSITIAISVFLLVVTRGSHFLTGWGKVKHPGMAHHTLQQVQMPPVERDVCAKKLAASEGSLRFHADTQHNTCSQTAERSL